MQRDREKRTVDMRVIADWVEAKARVLDLGCGRGVLLDYLRVKKEVFGVGVDLSLEKVQACVKKKVPVYHGDLLELMQSFPDQYFDRVICSRTVQELPSPKEVLEEALRVGKKVTVGFVNQGFWKNRWRFVQTGNRMVNEVFPKPWYESHPTNPVSVGEFEEFCAAQRITIHRRVFLGGDWQKRVKVLPRLTCGYAIFDLSR